MTQYERSETQLRQLLDSVADRLPGEDLKNVEFLIDPNACGMALQTFCTQLCEFAAKLRTSELANIRVVAKQFNVDVSHFAA